MNKADLIEALAPRLGGRAEAATAVEALVDVVLREVAAGGSVGVTGFGVFERVDRAARTGRNPRTGEAVPISATSSPRFRAATYFKDVVADPSELPKDGLAGVRVSTHEETERAGAPASVRRVAAESASAKTAAAKTAATKESSTKEAPATRGSSTRETAATKESSARETPAQEGTARKPGPSTSGKPATVRKVAAEASQDTGDAGGTSGTSQDKGAAPARGGPMVIGGEDITRSMIAAKKAQLAKVKKEQVTAAEKKSGKKSEDKKKSDAKKAGAKKSGGKKSDAQGKKSGKKAKKSKKSKK